ncbi:MAG: sigma-70 family RNA polymerase sigma factor [Planctomycetes bacterium]|nr:sigma-70 family RNA polymerase sigma factor [Planctomycetota bacterium]
MFPETKWSLILPENDSVKHNTEYFIVSYWEPVCKYIQIEWNKSSEEAKDLTQEFFTKLIENNTLETVSPTKGRLRTFVKTCLNNFLINNKKFNESMKRGGKSSKISISTIYNQIHNSNPGNDPADFFDKEWAKTVIISCIEIMRKQLVKDKKELYFKVFELYNSGEDSQSTTYESVAAQLNLQKYDIKNYLLYTRRLLKNIIIEKIESYCENSFETAEELNYICSLLTK